MLDITAALEAVMRCQTVPQLSDTTSSFDDVDRLATAMVESTKRGPKEFSKELRRSLVEASRHLDRVTLAVTGMAWLGSGITSVEQEMLALVRGAQRNIGLCAYSITDGAMTLLHEISEVVSQGVSATLIVNAFEDQPATVQNYLRRQMRERPKGWTVLDFQPVGRQTDLHAKLLTVDGSIALIGSANLSFYGMVSNHEMAVVLRGPAAETVAQRFAMLSRSAAVRSFD